MWWDYEEARPRPYKFHDQSHAQNDQDRLFQTKIPFHIIIADLLMQYFKKIVFMFNTKILIYVKTRKLQQILNNATQQTSTII